MRRFRSQEDYENWLGERKEKAWPKILRDEDAIEDHFNWLFETGQIAEELKYICEHCPEAVEDALSASHSAVDIFHSALLMSDEFAERHKDNMIEENDDYWRD